MIGKSGEKSFLRWKHLSKHELFVTVPHFYSEFFVAFYFVEQKKENIMRQKLFLSHLTMEINANQTCMVPNILKK